jgi:hypothetical protein
MFENYILIGLVFKVYFVKLEGFKQVSLGWKNAF